MCALLFLVTTVFAQQQEQPQPARQPGTQPTGQQPVRQPSAQPQVVQPTLQPSGQQPSQQPTAEPAAPAAAPIPKYSISFKKDKVDSINIHQSDNKYQDVYISATNTDKAELKDYKLTVTMEKGGFPADKIEISTPIENKLFKDLKTSDDNLVTIRIKKDDGAFTLTKPVTVTLKFEVKDSTGKVDADANNEGKIKEFKIVIQPFDEKIGSYKYLGYLGTNFDLVDGVQAKNLFFATNIFIPETNKWGVSFGVYGNRTMTRTDTSKNIRFTSRIALVNPDSVAYYRDSADRATSRVSDNIGIHFSPMIPIKCLTDGDLKLYYAPQFEFIWRRTQIISQYLNNGTYRIDSAKNRYPVNVSFPLTTPLKYTTNLNIYDAYIGLIGLLLRYENSDISIRVQASVGLNLNYVPAVTRSNEADAPVSITTQYIKNKRLFFFGRMWITEPYTGFTLHAEVSNFFGKVKDKPDLSLAQPYINVTLSKAFNLKNLAAIVKPLSQR